MLLLYHHVEDVVHWVACEISCYFYLLIMIHSTMLPLLPYSGSQKIYLEVGEAIGVSSLAQPTFRQILYCLEYNTSNALKHIDAGLK